MINTLESIFDNIAWFEWKTNSEKILIISFLVISEKWENIFSQKEVLNLFNKLDLEPPWNLSRDFKNILDSKIGIQKSILLWEYKFSRELRKKFDQEILWDKHIKETSIVLRDLLLKIKWKEQIDFLEEAISCFEYKANRWAIILTWLLTIDIIYEYILLDENLIVFNTSIQNHWKYKKIRITKKDDFQSIWKESDFIEILKVWKFITNDTRKILDEKLWIRNTCAHPNSVSIDDYKAISFIQDLVKNVIINFQ